MVDCFWRCLNCSVPFFPIIRRLDRHWRTYQDLIRQLSKDPHLSSLFADSIKKEFTFVFSSLPSIAKSMYRVISSFHLFQACGSSLGFPKSKLPGGLSWEIDRSAAALVLGVPSVSSGILFDESHFWHHVTSRKFINDKTQDFTSAFAGVVLHTCRPRKVTWSNTILLLHSSFDIIWKLSRQNKILKITSFLITPRLLRRSLSFTSLTAVQIYDFHIFTTL